MQPTARDMQANQFPILNQGIYANHAAIAPWPGATAKAVAAFAQENALAGPLDYKQWITRERELRNMLARLVGAPSGNDIALLKNTTEGISAVAFGFPFQAGDNIVLPQGEFPSNHLPWLAQAERGVEIRHVDIRAGDNPERALLEAMDDRTRVLAVSSVGFGDGLKLDLEKLGKPCRTAGILFFVDAIQQLGALPLDVEAACVDVLAADAHKWLLGPEGIALFYCNPVARDKLRLTQVGWHMYDYPWNFDRDDWSPSKSARRFEAGSPNTLGQVGLHASLSLLLEIGLEAIAQRILANTGSLLSGLSALPGVSLNSAREVTRQSGIVSFSAHQVAARELHKRLAQSGVTSAVRDGAVRLSPHFYQDEVVIQKLLQRVEDSL